MGDQVGGFTAVKVVGDPGREERFVAEEVFAGGGAQVESLEGVVKFEARAADGFELGELFGREGPGFWGELPGLILEQRLRGERRAEVFVGQIGHGAEKQ